MSTHLHHGDHALVGDGVRADAEVARGVPADDAVDSVPVRGVGLISVHHSEVCDHHLHPVFGDFPCILRSVRKDNITNPCGSLERLERFFADPGGPLLPAAPRHGDSRRLAHPMSVPTRRCLERALLPPAEAQQSPRLICTYPPPN